MEKYATPNTSSADIIQNMSLDLFFGYMGIQLDAQKAIGEKITLPGSPIFEKDFCTVLNFNRVHFFVDLDCY
jgi:alkyl sulfatase BDS1-like metallo-beta-lactamase superfamily hydrolase